MAEYKEMSLMQFRNRKLVLEMEISKLISEFEAETGLRIKEDVKVLRAYRMREIKEGTGYFDSDIVISTQTKVEL